MTRTRKLLLILALLVAAGIGYATYDVLHRAPSEAREGFPRVTNVRYLDGSGEEQDFPDGGPTWGGFALPEGEYADFRIMFPADSMSARQESFIQPAGGSAQVSFQILTQNALSGVQVLRWPLSAYGTDSPLDDAQRVNCQQEGERYVFQAENGYLYSVYLTWQNYFVEFPFQVR